MVYANDRNGPGLGLRRTCLLSVPCCPKVVFLPVNSGQMHFDRTVIDPLKGRRNGGR
jgi:hypothetical protein